MSPKRPVYRINKALGSLCPVASNAASVLSLLAAVANQFPVGSERWKLSLVSWSAYELKVLVSGECDGPESP